MLLQHRLLTVLQLPLTGTQPPSITPPWVQQASAQVNGPPQSGSISWIVLSLQLQLALSGVHSGARGQSVWQVPAARQHSAPSPAPHEYWVAGSTVPPTQFSGVRPTQVPPASGQVMTEPVVLPLELVPIEPVVPVPLVPELETPVVAVAPVLAVAVVLAAPVVVVPLVAPPLVVPASSPPRFTVQLASALQARIDRHHRFMIASQR